MSRGRRLWSRFARTLIFAAALTLLLVTAVVLTVETAWGKGQLRDLVVGQANRYLTARLEMGRLDGSLLRGLELHDVRLSRGAETLVAVDRVALSYSIRQLFDGGSTAIQRLELDRLRVTASREADGRWNLASLVRRQAASEGRGPGRPIRIDTIVIRDGEVTIGSPVTVGAATIPTQFAGLNATVSFSYQPLSWSLEFADASFVGAAPDLTVLHLAGGFAGDVDGWRFQTLHVRTVRSEFTLDGGVDRRVTPPRLDLTAASPHFAFQEWGGILGGLRNIAVDAAFDVHLVGPAAALQTTLSLRSDGGDVEGDLVLDTSVPGWHSAGTTTVRRLDLARWLNRPDRVSDISGQIRLDLDLQLGRRFPLGSFDFSGTHAAYAGYQGDDVRARGTITAAGVRIASATATAYGANVRLSPSTLAIAAPYRFRFVGRAHGLDLRQLPRAVPVPHVESTLALDFDVAGQFTSPFIRGSAEFDDSDVLGAQISAGATGSIDTLADPLHYAGEGEIAGVDLHRFGEALEIDWLRDPRFAGSVSGRFHVDATGSDLATMQLTGGGRLAHAAIFDGELRDADVEIGFAAGSLVASFDGDVAAIDPSIPMADERYRATLTGRGRGTVAVRDLLVRSPELDDYRVNATLSVSDSVVQGFDVATGTVVAALADGVLSFARLTVASPALDVEASGSLALDGVGPSRVEYRVLRSDLAPLEAQLGRAVKGELLTTGLMEGPLDAARFSGSATVTRFESDGVSALTTTGSYDITIPDGDLQRARGAVKARVGSLQGLGREFPEVEVDLAYDAGQIAAHVLGSMTPGVNLALHGDFTLDAKARTLDVATLVLAAGRTTWRLSAGARPRVTWGETAIEVRRLELVDVGNAATRVRADGTWMPAGGGTLRIVADGLSIDFLTTDPSRPALYGGMLGLTADVTGSSDSPAVVADFSIVEGRLRRMPFNRFAGHLDYRDEVIALDVRLDQAPGAWITAEGRVPAAALGAGATPAPIDVSVRSSPISLTLVEGLSDYVRNVTGVIEANVRVLGMSDDPHLSGTASLSGAAFQVTATGARYRNGRATLRLATDRIDVESLHVEDENGHSVDMTGSLGTHELRVGDLRVDAVARDFQLLRNEFGTIAVDAQLSLSGQFESPRVTGRVSVTGGELSVERILERSLFQPYATQEAAFPVVDPLAALNPWDRMGLDIEVKVPRTLRLVGENLQVGPGTPLGLGNINLRVLGDLYLYKDPAQLLSVTGSLDQVTGTYVFQGRQFELNPNSSINFRGDVSPELYVMVSRVISGVETRVSIIGPLSEPELRLTSTPPLDPSDILSLIVFNSSINDLSASQQQQLAVRAGTLAAGFLAAPMMNILERSLGLETLELETGGAAAGGARLTIGSELAPGLVARFGRQFGENQYDEATLEYYLSRILRVRATFSDAGSLTALSPFRRVERAGIDLLFFFSF